MGMGAGIKELAIRNDMKLCWNLAFVVELSI